jgi:hypothetical protein
VPTLTLSSATCLIMVLTGTVRFSDDGTGDWDVLPYDNTS